MQQPAIGNLLVDANFGRKVLSTYGLRVATSYRMVLTLLIAGFILAHLPLVGETTVLGLLLGAYIGYRGILLLPVVASWLERSGEVGQIVRAVLGILGLTIILVLLAQHGNIGLLWILYVPALMVISRYSQKQFIYFYAAGVVAVLVAYLHIPRGGQTLALEVLFATIITPALAILVVSFLIHYLARVDFVAKLGNTVRDGLVQQLLQRVLVETDGVQLWRAIATACAEAIDASRIRIYRAELSGEPGLVMFDDSEQDDVETMHSDRQVVRRALEVGEMVARKEGNLTQVAVPIYDPSMAHGRSLAVVVATYTARHPQDSIAAQRHLTAFLQQIWPLCEYAALREQIQIVASPSVHHLSLNHVIDRILDTLCKRHGFSFATVSLVDEHAHEIRTERGRNVPDGWVQDAHHPLDSRDIQAEVLRSGKVEIIAGWDDRFDRAIWEKYGHDQLVRIWVPLGRIGTIEAGHYAHEGRTISELRGKMLARYARSMQAAIQNAQVHEREQRHRAFFAALNKASFAMQTEQIDERAQLNRLAHAARDALRADAVALHPYHAAEHRFLAAAVAKGSVCNGDQFSEAGDLVRQIAENRHELFYSDGGDVSYCGASFAGVPLIADGQVRAVLAVHYEKRHVFDDYEKEQITAFAQMATGVIVGDQLVRDRERRRLENDLHNWVKSSVRGLIDMSMAASDNMATNPEFAEEQLHEVRRSAWMVLSDIEMILQDLTPGGFTGGDLAKHLERDLTRFPSPTPLNLALDVADIVPPPSTLVMRTLLSLVRETYSNVVSHAQARHVAIAIAGTAETVELCIADDGIGIPDVELRAPHPQHRGLAAMHEQVAELGGTLTIATRPAYDGTQLRVSLPRGEAA